MINRRPSTADLRLSRLSSARVVSKRVVRGAVNRSRDPRGPQAEGFAFQEMAPQSQRRSRRGACFEARSEFSPQYDAE